MSNIEQDRIIEIVIPVKISRERLDRYIGRRDDLNITRSRLQKLIESGLVLVDGFPAGHNHQLKGGEKITIRVPPSAPAKVEPENLPLEIAFEDDHLLVVNKPAGMVTHPGAGNRSGTLVNALLYYSKKLSGLHGYERPGIVHRLDKNTSGLILVAKNDRVHLALQAELKEKKIRKVYRALICGHVKKESGVINLPVGRSIKDRKKMTVSHARGRTAHTEFTLLDRFKLYDLLEISIKTGRTHQIRVHFSHLGHPIFGDPDYGGRLKWHRGVFSVDKKLAVKALDLMPRQALHAESLQFIHPVTGKVISVDSELPEDFQRLLQYITEYGR
jgi:23S rRNA pseudouridine1911/1915/1917 synthase